MKPMFWILVRFSEIAAEEIGPRQHKKWVIFLIQIILITHFGGTCNHYTLYVSPTVWFVLFYKGKKGFKDLQFRGELNLLMKSSK